MIITRNKGIVDLQLNITQKEHKTEEWAKLVYNRLCFILNLAIPLIDELEETNVYRQDVKYHANQLRQRIIGICDQHQLSYIHYGKIPNEDKMIEAEDVYNITSKAYELSLDWLFRRPPHHIVSTLTAIQKMEAKQPDLLDQIETQYHPVLK